MTKRHSFRIHPTSTMWPESVTTNLLYEDFTDRVVPYLVQPSVYELSAGNAQVYEIEDALALDHQSTGVDDFIRGITSRLLTSHEVWIEVVIDDRNPEGLPFQVWEVNGAKRMRNGKLVQELPDRRELPKWFSLGEEWPRYIELDPDYVVRTTLPTSYPSKTLRRVVQELAEIPWLSTPHWVLDQFTDSRGTTPQFDPKEIDGTNRLRTLQAALPIGWAAREELFDMSRNINDYYLFRRDLQFLHFIASMRERAEAALREVLTIAGNMCGFEASVTARGVYTPDAICGFMNQLQAGELAFSERINLIFQHSDRINLEQRRVV